MNELKQQTLSNLTLNSGEKYQYYSLPNLATRCQKELDRIPSCIRILLESVLRNIDDENITEQDVINLCGWVADDRSTRCDVPFVVARILLQDFTGVPLLADLAAMRERVSDSEAADAINPLVPVQLVVDHSIQVDHYAHKDAMKLNMSLEFQRNYERYEFLKWGASAFAGFEVIPPGVGIVHQVNLEHLAKVAMVKDGFVYPDTVAGADSHTTMINGIGVVGWGVGGIEAEAGMLGQPLNMLAPDVIGVHLKNQKNPGVTATDVVLTITELLRKHNVVAKFVEFFGQGAQSLSVPDRATVANMAPEYGATIGYFPVDNKTLDYLSLTGRPESQIELIEKYYRAQGLFGIAEEGQCDYTEVIELDLASIKPCIAGPKRPQDRIELDTLKNKIEDIFTSPKEQGGYGLSQAQLEATYPVDNHFGELAHGDVLLAAITSCTNTSNPSVLIAAALLARNARALGLKPAPKVKTSFAPGSRVVHDYLQNVNLLDDLSALGFAITGYGCTTCIGNSGPLAEPIEKAIVDHQVIGASVLSGNRNFEGRVHHAIKANFLMSPPLVVAFALTGKINHDFTNEPLGYDQQGNRVMLSDIWPDDQQIAEVYREAIDKRDFSSRYGSKMLSELEEWNNISVAPSKLFNWKTDSTYVRKPPFMDETISMDKQINFNQARALVCLGDSVTTDHISPAGAIKSTSAAANYLKEHSIALRDFNSYGSRRGNHEVMMRGTFANVRLHNLLAPDNDGGFTTHQPSGEIMSIFDAAEQYRAQNVPLVIFAGKDYGQGSSRDWAAKGPRLLGVRTVIANSFERIHRSNLIGMGIIPCLLPDNLTAQSLNITGKETFDFSCPIDIHANATLTINYPDGNKRQLTLLARIDTIAEVNYILADGILPYVVQKITNNSQKTRAS